MIICFILSILFPRLLSTGNSSRGGKFNADNNQLSTDHTTTLSLSSIIHHTPSTSPSSYHHQPLSPSVVGLRQLSHYFPRLVQVGICKALRTTKTPAHT